MFERKYCFEVMITRITGTLSGLSETAAAIQAGHFEYEVLIPEFVRRQLQSKIGQEVSLKTIEYIDGNPQQGKLTPRLIGFMHEAEREFFATFCQVDGIGVKTALRAMVRPVKDIAEMIRFLAGPESSYCTGDVFKVSGGYLG